MTHHSTHILSCDHTSWHITSHHETVRHATSETHLWLIKFTRWIKSSCPIRQPKPSLPFMKADWSWQLLIKRQKLTRIVSVWLYIALYEDQKTRTTLSTNHMLCNWGGDLTQPSKPIRCRNGITCDLSIAVFPLFKQFAFELCATIIS